jgi:DNA-binding FrmR family transcriptional regulator
VVGCLYLEGELTRFEIYYTLGGMKEEEVKSMQQMLRRIQGQVGGIERMLDEGRGNEDVLTQLSAAMSSLKTVARKILAAEATRCSESSKASERYATLLKRFF